MSSPPVLVELRARLSERFPSGSSLPDRDRSQRHSIILVVLLLMVPTLVLVALVQQREIVRGLIAIAGAVTLPALLAWRLPHGRLGAVLASLGLMDAASVLVHLSSGSIEAHFMFFVLLPLVALYQDWLPFLVAVVAVMTYHVVFGLISPTRVYDHHSAQHAPLTWAMIHGAFIVALILVLLIHWNAAENGRRELNRTIGELQATQMQLVHAQKLEAIGQLAAGIAHEINTPIQYIGDNLRFLDSAFSDLYDALQDATRTADRPVGPTSREAIGAIAAVDQEEIDYLIDEVPSAIAQSLHGIERVAEIVRALKGIAHPNPDRTPGTDINRLIRDTVVVTRNEWKHSTTLDCMLADDLPTIDGAAGPLGQVLVNMIVNSVHAIDDRVDRPHGELGHIRITTSADDRFVRIEVTDDGCGMSPEVRSRAFDPFFTTKAVGRGTGQGLSISRAVVVEQHRGAIDIESTPGRGTSITIRLPIAAVDAEPAAPAAHVDGR